MANRIHEWRTRRGLSLQALADRVGTSRQQMFKLERGERRLTEAWMRRIAQALDCAPANLMADIAAGPPSPALPLAEDPPATDLGATQALRFDRRDRIPVYASAQGGPDGTLLTYDPIEYVDRPEPLFGVRAAFAMYVVNDSMEPKYSQGALLLIHPARPVRTGDFVVVVRRAADAEHSALVKQLVRIDRDRLVLRQFNPPGEFTIPRADVAGIHLVIGSYEAR